MRISLAVATTHLTSRLRPTLVSLGGVVMGVAFFLAVSSLMRGSENDFLKRLIDNNPHITVYDEYRNPPVQPAQVRWGSGAVRVLHVKPHAEPRGIRGYRQRSTLVEALPGIRVAPVLTDSAVLLFAGHQQGVTLSGIVPARMETVTTLRGEDGRGFARRAGRRSERRGGGHRAGAEVQPAPGQHGRAW